MKKDAINWFELAVEDLTRAKRFYETILSIAMQDLTGAGTPMALFPYDPEKGVGGSLTKMAEMKPGEGGTLVYLNVDGEIDEVLARIPAAGGTVLKGRTAIPPHGFIGIFQDSEGNVVGLHSMS
jgi:hypothetical protein